MVGRVADVLYAALAFGDGEGLLGKKLFISVVWSLKDSSGANSA